MASAAMNLQLKKFSMSQIPEDAVCIFIGRRRTGKSTLVRDVLFHHKTIPLGTVISGTEESNDFYKKMVPPLFIHGAYSPVIVQNYVNRQKLIMKKIMTEQMSGGQSRIDPRSFLILDDCLYDDTWTRDLNVRYLFLNGRWVKVFFLITMQYPLGVPPVLRTNVDYVFILREPYLNNRKRIHENYCSMFPTLESFCSILDQTTSDFECLVINNNAKSNRIQDMVFWYKAETRPDFRLGSKEFWELSKGLDSDDEEQYDPTKNKKKQASQINVKKTKW